jgi:hypothetical protein
MKRARRDLDKNSFESEDKICNLLQEEYDLMQFDRGYIPLFSRGVLHLKNALMCSKSDNYTILHYINSRDYTDSAFHSRVHPVS